MDAFTNSRCYGWFVVLMWIIVVSALIRMGEYQRFSDVVIGYALGMVTTAWLRARSK